MKHFILIVLLAFVSATMFAQRPTGKVRKAFEKQYPAYEKESWSYEGERIKEWTVSFFSEGDSAVATYDSKGNWILTLTTIGVEELPQAVLEGVEREYQGSKIILAARYEEPGFDGFGVAFMYKKDRWGVQISKEGEVMRRKLTGEGFDF